MLDHITTAAHEIFTLTVMGYIVLGVLIGYIVGALPGMNRVTAIALALPFTFTMSPAAALSFLIGINKGGAAGSAVSAILLNVPGEPSSVVTTVQPMGVTGSVKSSAGRVSLKLISLASTFWPETRSSKL